MSMSCFDTHRVGTYSSCFTLNCPFISSQTIAIESFLLRTRYRSCRYRTEGKISVLCSTVLLKQFLVLKFVKKLKVVLERDC